MSWFADAFEESGRAMLLDGLGETVSYTPDGGALKSITAIVDRQPQRENVCAEGVGELTQADVMVSTDATEGIATPARKDVVTFDAADWSVVEVEADDNEGLALLQVQKFDAEFKGRQDMFVNHRG